MLSAIVASCHIEFLSFLVNLLIILNRCLMFYFVKISHVIFTFAHLFFIQISSFIKSGSHSSISLKILFHLVISNIVLFIILKCLLAFYSILILFVNYQVGFLKKYLLFMSN